MKYINLTKNIAFIAMLSLVFLACKKPKVSTPMGDAGQTLVKILGGGTPANVIKNPVDFVPTPTVLRDAISVRRDIANESELQKTMIITVKDDTAAVRAANPNYLHLPTAWYTIQTQGVKTGGQAGTYTFTLAPGVYSQEISITIPNATLFNPSALYGLGFTIMTADAAGKISTQRSVVIEIGAKNQWDGIYAVTGPMIELTGQPWTQWNNPASPGFPAANGGAWEGHLVTTGGAQCILVDQTIWGSCGHPMLNAGANSGFGSYGVVIDFNPSNGTIANMHNYYGNPTNAATNLGNPASGSGAPLFEASNSRRVAIDPSGVNQVQGNRDILLKYFMLQRTVIAAPPHVRITFDEKWKYVGSR